MSNSAKLSARERIENLLDNNSFVEIGALVTKRNTDFNLQTKEAPSDGVITGYGIIDGNPVYVYSQDVKVMNGTIGEMHARKIAGIYDLAMKVGAPVIGLIDCGGMRLQEAADALDGIGQIYMKQVMASGVIPQIAAVFGSCGGGLSVAASMNDFVFVEKNNGKIFINTPNAVVGNNTAKCDTASADFKAECGVVDFVGDDETDVLTSIRELINFLPSCNDADCMPFDCTDDLNRELPALSGELEDVTLAIRDIADNGLFVEVKSGFAGEMVTGFIKLNGSTVGVVANRTAVTDDTGKKIKSFDAALTAFGCRKAERFVKTCDAFNIPILTLTNVAGYAASVFEEQKVSQASAALTFAFANATVPKVNLITKKAIGSSYVTMNSKSIGADMVFALPDAEIGTMEADLAVQIMFADELKTAKDAAAFRKEKADEYAALQLNAAGAAKRGYVDAIIEAEAVRKNLIYAFEMLYTKRENRPAKKHGTI